MPRKNEFSGVYDNEKQVRSCLKCEEVKPFSAFNKTRGAPQSRCKSCHAMQYNRAAGYETPSARANRLASEERREAYLSELLTCPKCGGSKTRKEWPKEPKSGRLNMTCCTTWSMKRGAEVLALGKLTCRTCNADKPLDDFIRDKRKSFGRATVCKQCIREWARMERHAKVDARRIQSERRRSRLARQTDGTITEKRLRALFSCAEQCPYCQKALGATDKSLDHIVPISKGGLHSIGNVLVCCKDCNTRKGAMNFDDWICQVPDGAKAKAEKIYRKAFNAPPAQRVLPICF